MLKIYAYNRGKFYSFHGVFGWLTSHKCVDYKSPFNSKILNISKVQDCLNIVNNPFLAQKCHNEKDIRPINIWIKSYAHLLVWLHAHFFPGLYLISKFRFKIYNDSIDATDVFCRIIPNRQNVLCLARSVFAATMSRSFSKDGTLFIGALLPTHQMHAWVIENQTNVCRYDYIWTNYTPVSIII